MKAVLFEKESKRIVEVVENLTDYNEQSITGSGHIEGINWKNIDFLILNDEVDHNQPIDTLLQHNLQPQVEAEKAARIALKAELTTIYEAQDPFLKAQFKPAREVFEQHFSIGEDEQALAILTSPYIPAEVQPIAQAIYQKYQELTSK